MAPRWVHPIVAALAVLAPAAAWPQEIVRAQRIDAIHDGDTVRVPEITVTLRPARLRLAGIDAPELGQPGPWAVRARDRLAELVSGRIVAVDLLGPLDGYGRPLVAITADGHDVAEVLAREGLAYAAVPAGGLRPPHWARILAAEAEARAARRGVWSDPRAVHPDVWRRQQRSPH